jgi:hypothetical protein
MVNGTYGEAKKVASIGTQVTSTYGNLCSATRRSKSVKRLLMNTSHFFVLFVCVGVMYHSPPQSQLYRIVGILYRIVGIM